MSLSNNYPDIRPVWMNDYSNAGVIDPRSSFIRSDTPPSYAAPSNVHYWSSEDHLSSENLVLESENYDINPWLRNYDLTPTGSQTAPDGSSNAWLLTPTAGTSAIRIQQSITLEANTAYTASVYMKAGAATHGFMSVRGTSSHYARVTVDFSDPTNPSSSGVNFTSVSATSTAVGSTGWYKVVLNFTSSTALTSERIAISPTDGSGPGASGLVTWTSAGNETMYLWGVQLNTAGSTDYQPTTTQIHREYAPTLKSVATAGAARFEYDPATNVSRGILIESSRTNLLTYSNNFSQWGATNVVAEAAAAVGPDGQLAYAMREDSTAGVQHRLSLSANNQSYGAAHTMSVYAKKVASSNQTRYLRLRVNGLSGEASVQFDLSNGTVVRTSGDQLDSQSISSVGNGWYRLTMTYTNTATTRAVGMIITGSPDTTDTLPSYDGDGFTSFALFGAMVEEGSHASSLITSNSGSQTTRASDSLSFIDDSIFEGGEHSIYWEGSVNGSISDPRFMELSDGTTSNRIQFFYNDGSKVMLRTSVDGVSSKASIQVTEPITASVKLMATLKTAEARVVSNGTTITSSTSDSFYSASGLRKINIGTNYAQGAQLDGHVKRVAIFSEALTEVEAQSLTS